MIGIRNNFVKQFTAYQTMVLSYRRYAPPPPKKKKKKNYKHCCSQAGQDHRKRPFCDAHEARQKDDDF